jgi:membrane protease subunit HflK
MRKFAFILVAVLLAGYLLTGVVQVRPGERAVVRRFGRVLDDKPEPGLHIGLPWGMDRVDRVVVDQVRSVRVGYQDEETPDESMPAGQLLTGDNNLVNVEVVLYYRVRPEEVAEFVTQQDRVDGLLTRAVEAAAGEWVAARTVDDVLLNGKTGLREDLLTRLGPRLEPYRLGVEVRDARVALIAPPEEVKDAFDAVTQAQTKMATQRYRAEQDAEARLRRARAEQYRSQQAAAAYAHARTLLARQDARRFSERLRQYEIGRRRNPHYLRQIWDEERGRLFAKLKAGGRIDLLDNRLTTGGLDLFTAPLPPERK